MLHDQAEFEGIIQKHPQEKRSLIPILQDFQATYNYLPPVALNMVSQTLDVPLIDIISVASFYNAFSLEPKGEHQVTVCMGTACHVRGAPLILEEFERNLDIEAGHTRKDGKYSLDSVACLGCCAIGPVVVADGEYYAQTSIRNAGKIVRKLEKKEKSDD
ncbi:MAG: NAD(P)H-dependent oxidoreductase subunit E [Candidatus Aminicenantes bacterium]|jgi:NADH-quinone oxidoreductase subunit E|nr:NAD(P)H-dependent oxidoreductase subunit E [Candidatus Aminicenantes bacterium]